MTTTTTTHGGSRPADGRKNNRGIPGRVGPIPRHMDIADLLPGAPLSESTVSAADITIWRCQACGAMWWDGYSENVYGVADGPPMAEVAHVERRPRHRKGCAMAAVSAGVA